MSTTIGPFEALLLRKYFANLKAHGLTVIESDRRARLAAAVLLATSQAAVLPGSFAEAMGEDEVEKLVDYNVVGELIDHSAQCLRELLELLQWGMAADPDDLCAQVYAAAMAVAARPNAADRLREGHSGGFYSTDEGPGSFIYFDRLHEQVGEFLECCLVPHEGQFIIEFSGSRSFDRERRPIIKVVRSGEDEFTITRWLPSDTAPDQIDEIVKAAPSPETAYLLATWLGKLLAKRAISELD